MNSKSLFVVIVAIVIIAGAAFVLSNRQNKSGAPQQSSSAPQVVDSATAAKNLTVNVTEAGFQPQSLTIKVGQTVTWINISAKPVSINSNPHPIHTDYPPLNLGMVGEGQSVSLKFDKPGTYKYHNHLDPSQTGVIIVE